MSRITDFLQRSSQWFEVKDSAGSCSIWEVERNDYKRNRLVGLSFAHGEQRRPMFDIGSGIENSLAGSNSFFWK